MAAPVPYVRQAGSGPGVVCIHSNASSSAQWRGLMELLAPDYSVFAPDSYGSGKSPDWHSDREISLRDEVSLLEPVLASAGTPLILIGHSYGAAVALMAALAWPGRVRAMALFEPTLFSLVDAQSAPPNGVDGIKRAVASSAEALGKGDKDAAARHFIDFWMGAGSWESMPESRRPAVAESVTNVRRWAHALVTEPSPASSFSALDFPVLYMLGQASPRSAHAVAEILIPQLPQVTVVQFEGLGHMAPVTDPERINAEIVQFLGKV
jgi:pimeloyl-ACP methyl ester carboxylesterase